MPRPKDGYTNAAGEKVPGVHDITGRYKEAGGLIQWAYSQGKKGVPLYQRSALDVGTAVHRMAELKLRCVPWREIGRIPYEMLQTPRDIEQAFRAYGQFEEWLQEHDVRAIAMEEALVSERWQYGGTSDTIALIDGARGLIDLKTCKTAGQVYLEQRLVMAAHGNLWHEHHPDLPLAGYHLLNLPKDGSTFQHHAFANLAPEWDMFTLQLECWRIEQGLTSKRTSKPKTIVQSPKAKVRAEFEAVAAADHDRDKEHCQPDVVVLQAVREKLAAAKTRRQRKPKLTVVETPAPAAPPRSVTMAEMMRAYGLVPPLEEGARC